jgi:hypothetical protein
MPALPWTRVSEVSEDVECVVMASRLPVASYLRVPSFLRKTQAIRGQLSKSDGLVGYALDARLFSKTFWTVSAWTSAGALNAFNRADPHQASVRGIRPHMQPTTFVRWTCRAGDLPVAWDDVHTRIDQQAKG